MNHLKSYIPRKSLVQHKNAFCLGGLLTVSLPPTISVFGFKDSGKTTVTTRIIEYLSSQNRRVLSAKHVSDPAFSLDTPGTDSYRHIEAGAVATFLHSESTTTLLLKHPISKLRDLLNFGAREINADLILLEGFRFWTQKHPKIGKIICVRTFEEVAEFQNETTGPILGQCTLNPQIQSVIQIPDEFPFLLKVIDKWLLTAPTISLGDKE